MDDSTAGIKFEGNDRSHGKKFSHLCLTVESSAMQTNCACFAMHQLSIDVYTMGILLLRMSLNVSKMSIVELIYFTLETYGRYSTEYMTDVSAFNHEIFPSHSEWCVWPKYKCSTRKFTKLHCIDEHVWYVIAKYALCTEYTTMYLFNLDDREFSYR